MLNETWKAVVGYEGIYEVSDKGRVRSLDRVDCGGYRRQGRVLKHYRHPFGYLTVKLSNGEKENKLIHQLVCETFIGPRPDGKEVCHGPKGLLDNSTTNLGYGTKTKNQRDRIRDGTHDGIAVVNGSGQEFISAAAAARSTGCNGSNITACCKGKLSQTKGHTWRYKHADN